MRCKNCDTPIEASFCPNCGQKNVDLERPLFTLLGEIIRETFEIDGRASRTLITLFRHPGVLTSEFLAGHRKRYSPPFRLYLVISILFFIVAAYVAGSGILLNEGQTLEADASEQARFVSDDLPKLMFLLLPVFALLLKATFPKRFYFDHLIHALHLHCASYVVLALLLPLEEVANRYWPVAVIQFALFFYMLAYVAISIRHVYDASRLATALKTLGIFLGYMIVVAGLFETASYFALMGSEKLPFLTD